MYLFLAVLGLCCVAFSLVAASRDYSLVMVCRLLNAMASFMADRAQAVGARASVVPALRLWSTGSVVVMHGLNCCEIFPDQG